MVWEIGKKRKKKERENSQTCFVFFSCLVISLLTFPRVISLHLALLCILLIDVNSK